jgi:NAD(P)-dependent dehydrogenase (short-subunit alcohol dehydrogenase family)
MTRTYVVTGSASGIGAATQRILEAQGHRVIGVDLHEADVVCDLATLDGRCAMLSGVRRASGGTVDAIVANAGIGPIDEKTIRVNFFGAIETLCKLRPLLLQSAAPRAVVTSSIRSLGPIDPDLSEACLAYDENEAAAVANALAGTGDPVDALRIYATSKHSLNTWLQTHSVDLEWAGAGIPLNGVAPGLFVTAATAERIADKDWLDARRGEIPSPLGGLPGEPEEVAHAIAWLAGAENTRITGQIVYVDGGAHRFMTSGAEPGSAFLFS